MDQTLWTDLLGIEPYRRRYRLRFSFILPVSSPRWPLVYSTIKIQVSFQGILNQSAVRVFNVVLYLSLSLQIYISLSHKIYLTFRFFIPSLFFFFFSFSLSFSLSLSLSLSLFLLLSPISPFFPFSLSLRLSLYLSFSFSLSISLSPSLYLSQS